jgi:hypothetical protein
MSKTIGHILPYIPVGDIDGQLSKIKVKTARHPDRRKCDIWHPNAILIKEAIFIDLHGIFDEMTTYFCPFSEVNARRASDTFTAPEEMGFDAYW